MKKLVFLLILGIIILVSNGCDFINPPVPPTVKQFTITAIAGSNGTINPTETVVDSGKDAILTITPAADYIVNVLKVDGTVVPSTTKLIIQRVDSNKKVEATFKFKFDEGTPEWYLVKYTWLQDSITTLIGDYWYDWSDDPLKTVTDYSADGAMVQLWNGHTYNVNWSFNKTTNPITLVISSGISYSVEFLNDKRMVLSFVNSQGILKRSTYKNNGTMKK